MAAVESVGLFAVCVLLMGVVCATLMFIATGSSLAGCLRLGGVIRPLSEFKSVIWVITCPEQNGDGIVRFGARAGKPVVAECSCWSGGRHCFQSCMRPLQSDQTTACARSASHREEAS